MTKSFTPLHIILLPGVKLEGNLTTTLEEKGYIISEQNLLFNAEGLLGDIILGPICYNVSGELTEKQLDVVTKSTRALVRARKKVERVKLDKVKKKKYKPETPLKIHDVYGKLKDASKK